MIHNLRMDPRLERRLAEKRAALDLQRPLPLAILAKLYEAEAAVQRYQAEVAAGAVPAGRPRRQR